MARGKNEVTMTFVGDSKQLERAFDRVGDSAKRMQSRVGEASAGFANLGMKAGTGFASSAMSALDAAGPQVKTAAIAVAAGAAAAMAPVLAAGITAGVLLAVGGGVLAAGIASAMKDPAVAAAFTGLKERASKAFAGFGDPFKAPLIRSAGLFADAIDRNAPALKRMGEAMAPLIDKLAPALTQLVEKALPGMEKAVAASVPLFDILAKHAPMIGEKISAFFDKIAQNAPAAQAFLDKALIALGLGIDFTGSFISFLADLFTAQDNFFNALHKALSGLPQRASSAFTGLFDGIKEAFRSSLNWVIDRWNNFRIPGIETRFGTIGGFETPNLPRFHQGGVMPGAPGTEGLALLQAGEKVLPANRSGGTMTLVIEGGGGSGLDRLMVAYLQNLVRTGQLRLVQG